MKTIQALFPSKYLVVSQVDPPQQLTLKPNNFFHLGVYV